MSKTVLVIVLLSIFCNTNTFAQVRLQSGEKPTHLIELYTSEGCYSCPPADRWLSSLKNHQRLFTDFVPLSFHVDYWNYLGWRDKYSRPAFSERQRRYHRLGQVSGVYTPGMFFDGREWRGWRKLDKGEFISRRQRKTTTVGVLTADYDKGGGELSFKPSEPGLKPGQAYLALLGVDIRSPVAAGENKGLTLQHDFVVLELRQASLQQNDEGEFVATLPAFVTEFEAPRYAIAAWVTNDNDSKPLQATGGWIQKTEN